MKATGALLVLAGSLYIAAADIRGRRRTLMLLQELAAALSEIEASIRWKRQLLPGVIAQQAERPLCGTYFAAVSEGLAQGLPLQSAWEKAFSPLQPRPAADCLCRTELSGDETHIMGNLHLTAESLRQLRQELHEGQRQEEKVRLGLLFSGAGMLIIFLL